MSNGALSDVDEPVRPRDLRCAGAWLARHGLADARPTPLLTVRLAARRRARLGDGVVLALLIMAAALALTNDRIATSASGGSRPHHSTPLLVLIAAVVALLAVRSLLEWWVRRVDRRAGAALSRRAALPIQPGWRALLGWPYAAFAVATFAGATLLAVSALTAGDSATRYAALVLLVGMVGVAIGTGLRFRDLLQRPVVAEDEVSLTADVIMRVEDAREAATPTMLWGLPVVLLFGVAPGWWDAAALTFVALGLAALVLIHARTEPSATVARHAMGAR
jgi:hypothetical protein